MKSKTLQFLIAVSSLLAHLPNGYASDRFKIQVDRVDELGEVTRLSAHAEWKWGQKDALPCAELHSNQPELLQFKACLTEASTLMSGEGPSSKGSEQRKYRYVFDLPFDHPVLLLSPSCTQVGVKAEQLKFGFPFGLIAVFCREGESPMIKTSSNLTVKARKGASDFDPLYEIQNEERKQIGKFLLHLPRPKPPEPIATPTPVATPTPTPTPVPTATPAPSVAESAKKPWMLGVYLGGASNSHTNKAVDGSGLSQVWSGAQAHVFANFRYLRPIFGWIPEAELHSSQLGSVSGLTMLSGSFHKDVLKASRQRLLLGFGANALGMNGSGKYGVVSAIGYQAHAIFRARDNAYFVSASYGPLLTPVPSVKSFFAGITLDYRIRVMKKPIHLGADLAWFKIPASTSGANVDYSSTSYSLMVGYYFGE